MKKSEKVEIRVSFDEKQRLARLAELEGKNVSELVRHLVRKYVEINTSPAIKKPSLGLSAALLLAGAALAALILALHSAKPNSAQYYVSGTIDNSGFGFTFSPQTAKPHVIDIEAGQTSDAVFRIETISLEDQRFTVRLCQIVEDDCRPAANWDIDPDPIWPSVLQTVGPNEESLLMSIQKMAS